MRPCCCYHCCHCHVLLCNLLPEVCCDSNGSCLTAQNCAFKLLKRCMLVKQAASVFDVLAGSCCDVWFACIRQLFCLQVCCLCGECNTVMICAACLKCARWAVHISLCSRQIFALTVKAECCCQHRVSQHNFCSRSMWLGLCDKLPVFAVLTLLGVVLRN